MTTAEKPTTPDHFTVPLAAVKRYRAHGCYRLHSTYRQWARCAWPSAAWITGEGPYAVLARCRANSHTITLHPDLGRARAALTAIDRSHCGGVCRGRHEFVEITLT